MSKDLTGRESLKLRDYRKLAVLRYSPTGVTQTMRSTQQRLPWRNTDFANYNARSMNSPAAAEVLMLRRPGPRRA